MKSKAVLNYGYLCEMVTKGGRRYRYVVRKKYLEIFLASAFDYDCTVEIIGFCKIPRNCGIEVFPV